ncbi:hypothetical protein MN608_01644 [Microdochium nivale]|nr:hypothetical protein MN608_01644 [Microdochium nivale]
MSSEDGSSPSPTDGNADVYVNVLTVFLGIALYNVLELTAWILGTFKRWSGLYFWSLCIATWGVAFNAVGYLLLHRQLSASANLKATLILVGWAAMVNGQSAVLYSRLHLVLHHGGRLRAIFWMIVINAVTMVIPIVVLVYGVVSDNPAPFCKPYDIYEKIQLSVFFIQEAIISAVYVWETLKLMQIEQHVHDKAKLRRLMKRLVYVNIAIILLDITIPTLEFSNNFLLQTSFKPLAYSIKLKLEFSILGQLVRLAKRSSSNNSFIGCDIVLASTITTPIGSLATVPRRRSTAALTGSPSPGPRYRHDSNNTAIAGSVSSQNPSNGMPNGSLTDMERGDLSLRKAQTLSFGTPSELWSNDDRE